MITVKSRPRGARRWTVAEFATNAEAEAYGRKLAKDHSIVWSGKAEQPDPPAATRAMWTGVISFGLVAAPVKMFAATEDGTPALKMLCREHSEPVSFRRYCPQGHEIHEGGTVKGVRNEDGAYSVLTDDELDALELDALPSKKTVAVETFVPADSVPSIYQDKCYFLAADKLGAKPYELLRWALAARQRAAIARIVLRDREHLCLIRAEGGLLTLTTLHWASEVRSADRLPQPEAAHILPAERVLAGQLVEAMESASFEPNAYRDEYADALALLASEKTAGAAAQPRKAPTPRKSADAFLADMQASIEAIKRERGAA